MSNGRLDRPVFVGAADSVVVNLFHGGYKVIDKVDPDYLKLMESRLEVLRTCFRKTGSMHICTIG